MRLGRPRTCLHSPAQRTRRKRGSAPPFTFHLSPFTFFLFASLRLCVRFSDYGDEYGKRVKGKRAIRTLDHSRGEFSESRRGFSDVRVLVPGRVCERLASGSFGKSRRRWCGTGSH